MQDIRNKTDDEISAAIKALGFDDGCVFVRRSKNDRVVRLDLWLPPDADRFTFEQLSQLAGLCMTPDITITPHVGVTIAVGWQMPLATGEIISVG